jgi:hypothetical protein
MQLLAHFLSPSEEIMADNKEAVTFWSNPDHGLNTLSWEAITEMKQTMLRFKQDGAVARAIWWWQCERSFEVVIF